MTDAAPIEPHALRIVVWDVPPAIERGTAFRVKVGVKCAADCAAAVTPHVVIRDADGHSVAGADVGETSWPGTALRYAELELRAPTADGLHAWEASVAQTDDSAGGPAHAAASTRFHVRAVQAPECVLKVIAVDARSGAPVPGAKVVVHPYRAMTNALGIAEIRVPKGAYRLFVSGCDRFPFRSDGEVNADVTIRAELDPDLGPNDAEFWA